MDFPDDASTTSSSIDSTVSDVADTLNSVALYQPQKEPTTIRDIPPEIILQIYRHLPSPSAITALNRTSRMYNWIWRINAPSISAAVLRRGISCYDSALELFEVEERVKQIHCLVLSHYAVLKRVRVAQQQAREAVRQGRRKDRCEHTSSDMLYDGVLYRNRQMLSAARNASCLLRLIENKVVFRGGPPLENIDGQIAPPSRDIIVAYYEIMILMRLRLLKAMNARLKTMCKEKIRKMLYVATYIVCHCPDKDKIRMGISRKVPLRVVPWSWVIDELDSVSKPRCRVNVAAGRAFFAIANAVGVPRIPNYQMDNRSGCHGDCEN